MFEKKDWRKVVDAIVFLFLWFGVPALVIAIWKSTIMPVETYARLYALEFPVASLLYFWMFPRLVSESKRTWWRKLLMFIGLMIALSGLVLLFEFFTMPLEVMIEE